MKKIDFSIIYSLFWKIYRYLLWILRYSGVEYILDKFYPSEDKRVLPTGFLWILGLYIALYGIASQRYENSIDIIENRANSMYAMLASGSGYDQAIGRIPQIQNMLCPYKPQMFQPKTVILSFYKKTRYDEMVTQLKETVEDLNYNLMGTDLSKATLYRANLRDANLSESICHNTNFEEANLFKANFFRADLLKSNFCGANLRGAILKRANLVKANFIGADLHGADLAGAKLSGVNFQEANLSMVKGLEVSDLKVVHSLKNAQFDVFFLENVKSSPRELLHKDFVENRISKKAPFPWISQEEAPK